MKLADWLTLGVLALVVAAVLFAKRRSNDARTAALSAARAEGHAAAMAAVTATQSVHLGGVHLGGSNYGVAGEVEEHRSVAGRAFPAEGDFVPVYDQAGTVIGYRRTNPDLAEPGAGELRPAAAVSVVPTAIEPPAQRELTVRREHRAS